MSEIEWRPVPGWGDYYEVSNRGEVRSLDRVTTAGQHLKGRIRTPNLRKDGYQMFAFYRGSARSSITVHRLVMLAFVGPCPEGQEVCHRNGVRHDNRLENLYYGTRSENNYDKRAHGTDHNASKTHCKYGHEFSPDNTYLRPEGGRRCRRCQANRYAQRSAGRAAA